MIAKTGVTAMLLVGLTAPSFAERDVARGKEVFQRCSVCHSLAAGDNRAGPSLHGIVGSKAATVPGYNFSKAMAASGIVWDDAALKKYLADPGAVVPGTKMRAGAIDDPQAIDDLIAYLKQAAQ
jgi:cytochrome c2